MHKYICEAMLEYYLVFAKEINPLPFVTYLSNFYNPSESQKIVNYFLLHWVQAWQDVLFTSTFLGK